MDTSLLRALRTNPTMRQLSAEEVEYIAGLGRVLCYLPGAYLFHESQPRRFWGLILKGRVELQQGPRGRRRVLHVMGPGESFGEGSLLEEYPHSTSAFVTEGSEVFEMPREALGRIAAERADLYGRLLGGAAQTIAGRLRSANVHVPGRGASYLSGETRREHDLLGDRDVPAAAYYGIQTLRAAENFPITGIPIAQYPHLIKALAAVKQAAAEANNALGLLSNDVAEAIGRACREIRAGSLHSEFVVDVIQGGA
ncbi:MAG: cyclic nucleotide-binding domain-containing protein, partial [Longimicrobiales bacterium]